MIEYYLMLPRVHVFMLKLKVVGLIYEGLKLQKYLPL